MTDAVEERLELSIDETNALRAKLGLKPLRVTSEKQQQPQQQSLRKSAQIPSSPDKKGDDNDDDDEDGDIFTNGETLGTYQSADDNALSWAQKMQNVTGVSAALKAAKIKKQLNSRSNTGNHTEQDLEGMTVAAGIGDIGNEETILTLKDESILDVNENNKFSGVVEGNDQLENLAITEKYKAKDIMKRKRDLAKYKSGYSEWDEEEEFDQPKSFQISGKYTNVKEDETEKGKISLDTNMKFATDYEEEEPLDVMKLKKSKKNKKDKKEKKTKKAKKKENSDEGSTKATIVDELEQSEVKIKKRKRRVRHEDSSDEEDGTTIVKRKNYKNAVKLAEQRTQEAFSADLQAKDESMKIPLQSEVVEIIVEEDVEEEDDAFLNLALEKARRLKRLQCLNKPSRDEKIMAEISDEIHSNNTNEKVENTIVFEADSTLDFATSLRNRMNDVNSRAAAAKSQKKGVQFSTKKKVEEQNKMASEVDGNDEGDSDINMVDLANDIKDDTVKDDVELDENLAKPVGRGLASVLGLLKSTGAVGGPKGGKEEMRGRAKDERTYDDYEQLNLNEVVKLDANGDRPDKDIEYANKEVKLEYRDDFGRLLTRKEAFRQLCYQFHGHGSGKKNEERRLKAIEREQASDHSRKETAGVSTISALKKTQEATGKAFVVHKN